MSITEDSIDNIKITEISGHNWKQEISIDFEINKTTFCKTYGDIRIWFDNENNKYKIQLYGCNKKFAKQVFCKLIDEAEEVK